MRRKSKRPVDPSKRAAQKKDVSHMLTTRADGFTVNEWLEGLITLRETKRETFDRNISAPVVATIARYEELKREHMKGEL